MKLVAEVIDSVLVIETEDEKFKIVLDIPTGEIMHFEHIDVTIHQLTAFINKARTRYNKFLNSKAIEDFI